MLCALVLPASYHKHAALVWSVAGLFSWLRLLRVLTLSASLGPLTLMCVRMLTDVTRLLVSSRGQTCDLDSTPESPAFALGAADCPLPPEACYTAHAETP